MSVEIADRRVTEFSITESFRPSAHEGGAAANNGNRPEQIVYSQAQSRST